MDAEYSPEIAVLTATLLALIWYTYFTRQGVEEARKAPEREAMFRRRALAAALLPEIRQLIAKLDARLGTPGPQPGTPLLNRTLDHVEVFPPEIAERLSELTISLDQMDDLYDQAEGHYGVADIAQGILQREAQQSGEVATEECIAAAKRAHDEATALAADLEELSER